MAAPSQVAQSTRLSFFYDGSYTFNIHTCITGLYLSVQHMPDVLMHYAQLLVHTSRSELSSAQRPYASRPTPGEHAQTNWPITWCTCPSQFPAKFHQPWPTPWSSS
ncbi:hypothetical protein Lalb_Chr18g0050901 [Lupinus albus]|uniref:Uncharacterized protein n=1 Tax=Lupinus albus TaxID=3870 RepID=A0A6A4NPU1_LUPAL|nr:hypothetical protein Lalb_Chr18g0050901 [Lupinus albus]